MSLEVNIRPVQFSEIPFLLDFAQRLFVTAYAHLNTPANMNFFIQQAFQLPQLTQEWNHPHSFFYFVEYQNTIIAHLKLNIKNAQTEQELPDALEIERIYIDSPYQGKGIGKQLIQFSIDKARALDCTHVWLGVWRKNEQAIRFYQREGFKQFSEHIFQFGNEAQVDYMLKQSV